jgi:hypothetical protein
VNHVQRNSPKATPKAAVPMTGLHVVLGNMVDRENRSLGIFPSKDAAAVAYDREMVKAMGLNALTNFSIAVYKDLLSAHLLQALLSSHSTFLALHQVSASGLGIRALHWALGHQHNLTRSY